MKNTMKLLALGIVSLSISSCKLTVEAVSGEVGELDCERTGTCEVPPRVDGSIIRWTLNVGGNAPADSNIHRSESIEIAPSERGLAKATFRNKYCKVTELVSIDHYLELDTLLDSAPVYIGRLLVADRGEEYLERESKSDCGISPNDNAYVDCRTQPDRVHLFEGDTSYGAYVFTNPKPAIEAIERLGDEIIRNNPKCSDQISPYDGPEVGPTTRN